MNFSTRVTENGIVRCDVFGNTFKTNGITLHFLWPLEKESATEISLLCSVLRRGNTVFGEMDKISAFLDLNYGASVDLSTSKIGEMQSLVISASYIDDRFALDGEKLTENIVKLLEAIIFSPIIEDDSFKKDFVLQEKQNLKDRILSLINDKQSYAFEKCKQTMFSNEKYGVYEQGDVEMLDKITPESLYAFYKNFIEKAMVIISYGGAKCDTDSLLDPIISKLSVSKRVTFSTDIGQMPSHIKNETEEMNVAQSKLNLGFRLGNAAKEDLFALKMFNVIFGASPTSKLFMNVREKLSLCYYCSSVADTIKNVMFVYSGVETANAEIAKEEILNQLSLMKAGEFTQEEFDNAKAYIIDSFIQAGDSAQALCNLSVAAYINGHCLTAMQQIEEIKKVTMKRVKKVAEDIMLDTVYLLRGIGGGENAENN